MELEVIVFEITQADTGGELVSCKQEDYQHGEQQDWGQLLKLDEAVHWTSLSFEEEGQGVAQYNEHVEYDVYDQLDGNLASHVY